MLMDESDSSKTTTCAAAGQWLSIVSLSVELIHACADIADSTRRGNVCMCRDN